MTIYCGDLNENAIGLHIIIPIGETQIAGQLSHIHQWIGLPTLTIGGNQICVPNEKPVHLGADELRDWFFLETDQELRGRLLDEREQQLTESL